MRPESRTKLTYDDFVLFPDDGMRHELIDGEHYATPSPNFKHQALLGNLHLLVGNWLRDHRIGRVMLSPFDVVFSKFDVVEPDLLYLSTERAARVLTSANVQGVPELVVEIGSPSTRKRDETISGISTNAAASASTGSWTRNSTGFASIAPVRRDSRSQPSGRSKAAMC
ncbi:MAG TPA: Uma2 family endonuclease [Vicinamibacterales bacterium]|jgi:Uma2 family endonuclease|nr:Uma2 family endonuclease [Vicinamibacterales bacterium]